MSKVYLALFLTTSFLAQAMNESGDENPEQNKKLSVVEKFKQNAEQRKKRFPTHTHSNQLHQELQEKAEELRVVMSQTNNSLDNMQQKTTDLEERNIKLHEGAIALLDMKLQLEKMKQRLEESEKELEGNRQINDFLQNRVLALQEEQVIEGEEKKKLQLQISTLEGEKLNLQQKVEEQEQEIKRLRLIIQELEQKLFELGLKFNSISQDNEHLSKQLSLKTQKKKQYKELSLQLGSQKTELTEKLDQVEKHLINESSKLKDALNVQKMMEEENRRIRQEQKDLYEKYQEALELNKKLDQEKQAIGEKLSKNQGDKESLELQLQKITLSQEELNKQIREASQALNSSKESNTILKEELEQMKRDNSRLQEELNSLGELYRKLQSERENEIVSESKVKFSNIYAHSNMSNIFFIWLAAENANLKQEVEKLKREKNLFLYTSLIATAGFTRFPNYKPTPIVVKKEPTVWTLKWVYNEMPYQFCSMPYYIASGTCSSPYMWNTFLGNTWEWYKQKATTNEKPIDFLNDKSWKIKDPQMDNWEKSMRKKRIQKRGQLPSPKQPIQTPIIAEEITPKPVQKQQAYEYDPPPFDMEGLVNPHSKVWQSPSSNLNSTGFSLSNTITGIKNFIWGNKS